MGAEVRSTLLITVPIQRLEQQLPLCRDSREVCRLPDFKYQVVISKSHAQACPSGMGQVLGGWPSAFPKVLRQLSAPVPSLQS